ncbi:enoyl-CoA hydratase-related protein [Brevibacillus humidisoli]|uniref:enoyl-CoA hydratase/isomerase family protein n=1 Tax=Brevibacillus humidisoli TaxID=2895522 RepID=UPI001E4E03AE|nr:enoyl-CoA hydratase-related protein [Brevibacillus humidisoli]UFJ40082.1 enoyl-CoA hydratase-related protein [Brevibacillus humidisoli]
MSEKDIVLYTEEDGIARITLNRPDVRNALSREVLQQLSSILDRVKENDHVKAVILIGAGEEAFSAGADIAFLNRATPLEVRELAQLAVTVTSKIESLGKVVVAAINGHALGGGLELAEACVLRVAAHHARLGHPEVRIGAVAGFGGTTRLPRLVGKGRAAELLLTGKVISAAEAHQIGLVNRVVEPDQVLPESEQLLREILAQAPIAVKMTWEALHRGCNLTLEESAQLGADYFGLIASTEDFREGTKSFLEKTKPAFKAR